MNLLDPGKRLSSGDLQSWSPVTGRGTEAGQEELQMRWDLALLEFGGVRESGACLCLGRTDGFEV